MSGRTLWLSMVHTWLSTSLWSALQYYGCLRFSFSSLCREISWSCVEQTNSFLWQYPADSTFSPLPFSSARQEGRRPH
ncbi:hypothetical protein BKA61DRAFT_344731 [Leptodontidium sp. MPI-SDFR-AT-0119]|nr:hypothetical protein BKA61DRAFT_344731 [Leptodontidium sp. MPI-SDFR-AT-0119]